MSEFNQEEFNNFVLENNVVGFFDQPIKLKSGRVSNWYVNWRNVAEDAYLLDQLTNHLISYVESNNLEIDTFYGVPEGATKLGVLTQYKWAKKSPNFSSGSHVLAMGRAKPKEHGAPKDRFFIGEPKGKVAVVEDVTTTGGSLVETLESLKEAGINVVAVISITNRMEKRDDGKSVKEKVEELGYDFYSMSTSLELLPKAYEKENPGEQIADNIEEEFNTYGVEPLKLK